ncbi:MAG: adenosine monophosphate-protein transferase [Thermoplasmata archaeon]|uniref:Adenosine monophosphate-protein transferase n=1 Tax=Candidatus Sysuiplasma superficiale TaxID=2823368 RepID=A0A8J7YJF6_9ARCH|nr:adenosine-specific kinase [Candidatus Sysuiplasma superficiale]MBX8644771.1 adenosine monophosphate-protein transferase [Candidatus Sysuiplasma superficiale]MCL4347021.1 adenosine-specific kinase [Candidatus Thermoplasmatota archaeon]
MKTESVCRKVHDLEIEVVEVEGKEDANVILAQSHFIKTAEDVYEALRAAVPEIRFGIAFNEASGPRLVRTEGNDAELTALAARNALRIGAGHLLVIFITHAFPINVMNALKSVSEITTIYCATANRVKVVICSDGEARSVLGIMDGERAVGLENESEKEKRKEFLRKIGYKL